MSQIDNTLRKRPKPAALMKLVASNIFQPIADHSEPNLADFKLVDIKTVWDYGPIGCEGKCWQHKNLEFYVVSLNNQALTFIIIPGFGVDQLKRMVVASHKIDGFRSRGGGGRRLRGYAAYHFEYRTLDTCFVMKIEENLDRTGLIWRSLPLPIHSKEKCTWDMFDRLYPEV